MDQAAIKTRAREAERSSWDRRLRNPTLTPVADCVPGWQSPCFSMRVLGVHVRISRASGECTIHADRLGR